MLKVTSREPPQGSRPRPPCCRSSGYPFGRVGRAAALPGRAGQSPRERQAAPEALAMTDTCDVDWLVIPNGSTKCVHPHRRHPRQIARSHYRG